MEGNFENKLNSSQLSVKPCFTVFDLQRLSEERCEIYSNIKCVVFRPQDYSIYHKLSYTFFHVTVFYFGVKKFLDL